MWFLLSLVSAFFSSATSLLEKKVLLKEHALAFSSTLAFCTFLISLPLFLIFDHNSIPQLLPLGIIAITAVLGGFAFLLITESVIHMDVSEISPLIAVGPAITALFGFAFLGEILTISQIIGIAIIILGVYILELKETSHLLAPFKVILKGRYVHFVFVALLLYACTDVLGKIVLSKYAFQAGTYLFYYQLFTAFFFLILLLIKRRISTTTPKISSSIFWILLIAVLTIIYRYTHISAMKLAPIGLAIAVFRSSTVLTTILGGKIYKEKGVLRKLLAALIVIAGVVLIAL